MVGELQLDVLKTRVEAEYQVKAELEPRRSRPRAGSRAPTQALKGFRSGSTAPTSPRDRDGDLVFMAKSPWDVGYQQEKNPELTFSATKER